jgi:hypothetical protein
LGATANLNAIATVVGVTAAAGGYNVQLSTFNTSPLFSGPRGIQVGGIFTFGSSNATMTGGTATVSVIGGPIDNWIVSTSLAGYADSGGPYAGTTGGRFGATGGITGGQAYAETPNNRPYFTVPFNGDSATAGGYIETGAGMSFGTSLTGSAGLTSWGYYGVNPYGGGTLNFPGATAYIKVIANDPNYSQNQTFSLPAHTAVNPQQIALGNTGIAIFQGSQLITGEIPTGVYEAFFGPTAQVNNNIGIIRICKSGATANQTYKVSVRVADNSAAGLTAISTFAVSFGATA